MSSPKSSPFSQMEKLTANFLIPAAQRVMNDLISLANHQISLKWGFERDLRQLRLKLIATQALLIDANNRRIASDTLQELVKHLKAGTNKAENVLDELAYETLRREVEVQNPWEQVRDFISDSINSWRFDFTMHNKVEGVNLRLDDICNLARDIGLSPANLLNEPIVQPMDFRLPTLPFIGDLEVVGRAGNVEKVRLMLLGSDLQDDSSEDDLSVIAIVGMGGIGKTTLAQLVYKDEKVVKGFDKRIWISVSDDFKVERLLNKTFLYITGDESGVSDIQVIVKKLKEKLNGKKYLLVLDNVWNTSTDKWECFWNSLVEIGGSKGSKIIVTTRTEDVVSTMQSSPSLTYRLEGLSRNDSWTLFDKIAFKNREPIKVTELPSQKKKKEVTELEDIGRRMVEKCEGVPLAIKLLGGLLSSKEDKDQWESIEKSEIWRSFGEEEGILPVLRLSFDHLPHPSLKKCFAYCAVFPKGSILVKDKLIQLWMGLGYLQPSSKDNSEKVDVGNKYFDILLRHSLLEQLAWEENDNITGCLMHDTVHALALEVSAGSCLTLEAGKVMVPSEVEHLSLCLGKETRVEISEENVGNLRSLFLTGHLFRNIKDVEYICAVSVEIDGVDCIRALSVEIDGVEELPTSIGKFKHLRYLDVSRTSIERLPDIITKLYNLETLRLPSSCTSEELPEGFHKLVNLRHLCFDHLYYHHWKVLPKKIGQLKSLQTLPIFHVGEESGYRIEELGNLSKLRGRLQVYNLQHVKDKKEAEKAKMLEKSYINELLFHWDEGLGKYDNNHEDVLEGLQPHKNLKALTLESFGGQRLPLWMRNGGAQLLQNLVTLELRHCRVCEQVPTLGHLPDLEFVEMDGLHNIKRIGPDFYGLDEGIVGNSRSRREATAAGAVFPALRELTVRGMWKLEEWSDLSSLPTSATSTVKFFPCLEKLYILACPHLITVPGLLLSPQSLTISTMFLHLGNDHPIHRPYLIIGVDSVSEKTSILMEDLLEKSSKSLRNLRIHGLSVLCYLPKQLLNVAYLEKLEISNCRDLENIIEDTKAAFNGLTSLQRLSVGWCKKLKCLPKGLLQQTVVSLELTECPELIAANPDELRSLTSLQNLSIDSCPGWASCWKEGLLWQPSIQMLVIGGFSSELEYFPWPSTSAAANPEGDGDVPKLKSLTLLGWPKLKSLPDQVRYLTALRELRILSFDGLEDLPEWLGYFSALETLELHHCWSLRSLEAIQRLKLQRLVINYCPLLKERYRKGGQEYNKIAHIQYIDIRGN